MNPEPERDIRPSRRRGRPWDDLSEIDRAVLLETIRQRRLAQAERRRLEHRTGGPRSMR